ncbi:hypothetical protein [Amaricoccus macauensis]|uniref:hypothetical protein n=1 Tax=Amaricoccus macauensis TaxID=57001 RepID=UPI003C7E2F46
MQRGSEFAPYLVGLAMVGLGLAARRVEPDLLSLPEPSETRKRLRDVRTGRDAARVTRDGIASFIPANLTKSMGRTLIIMGAALVAVRALDELVDDDGADY